MLTDVCTRGQLAEVLEEPPGVVTTTPAVTIVAPENNSIDACFRTHDAGTVLPGFLFQYTSIVRFVPGVTSHELIVF